MYSNLLTLLLLAVTGKVICYNFDFESIQLQNEDTQDFPSIAFGNCSTATFNPGNAPECKASPGSLDWPVEEEWAQLNTSLGGVLLKPSPPGAVCYNGTASYNAAMCNFLLFNTSSSRFYINDPVTVLTAWAQGNTCPATLRPQTACTHGGFPTYVVNATTVKQIQMAMNFARNRNIRLIIKNTGHDFNGRSAGAGAISVWTHNLKSFEFVSEYTQHEYSGMAARVASGLESWEMFQYMDTHNMTLVVPGDSTVGVYGGWMAGGGHSNVGSYYGLGSDQPLSLQVVTADGRFVTADPDTNPDLFYALRGGGPGTYGIVTSAIVKAYPPIQVTAADLSFQLRNPVPFPGDNFTPPSNSTNLFPMPVTTNISAAFWQGWDDYNYFGKEVVDAGGTAYSYISISRTDNRSASFRTTFEFPGKTITEVTKFLQPFFNSLNKMGIPVPSPAPMASLRWVPNSRGLGDSPFSSRFASRLFPYKNWEDKALFNKTMRAIRETIEGGYTFHGIHIKPTKEVAGYPGHSSSVNPAFRTTIMHADVFDFAQIQSLTPEEVKSTHARFNSYMNKIRDVTPGPDGGAYVNEADVLEPDWQNSFFGDNYPGLLDIKQKWDPWGLFWAPTTVGSEGWEVRTADGLPSQNGHLCRV